MCAKYRRKGFAPRTCKIYFIILLDKFSNKSQNNNMSAATAILQPKPHVNSDSLSLSLSLSLLL